MDEQKATGWCFIGLFVLAAASWIFGKDPQPATGFPRAMWGNWVEVAGKYEPEPRRWNIEDGGALFRPSDVNEGTVRYTLMRARQKDGHFWAELQGADGAGNSDLHFVLDQRGQMHVSWSAGNAEEGYVGGGEGTFVPVLSNSSTSRS